MADSSEEPSTSGTREGRGADSSSTYTAATENNSHRGRRRLLNQNRGRRNHRGEETQEQRLVRMQAVVNNTPFKTGWEVKEANEVKEEKVWLVDVVTPDEFVNDEYAHTLSPEEQRLHNWKKTQRGIDTRFKCISMDTTYRTLRRDCPTKKLRSPDFCNDPLSGKFKKQLVSYVIQTNEPCPTYSDEPLPDSGKRSGLDLRCIQYYEYLRALTDDIKGVAGRRILTLGPTCSRHVEEYCNEKCASESEVLGSVVCHSKSSRSDPNCRIDVIYPDELNYKKEEEQFRKSTIQPQLDEMRFQFLNVRHEGSNYVCSLTDGLQPTIHLISKEKFTRILCITELKTSEFRNGLIMRYTSFIGMRKLKATEILVCLEKADEWNLNEKALIGGDFVYEVVFGESGEGQDFSETFGSNSLLNYFSSVVRWPEELDDDYNDRFYSLVATWYTSASMQKGHIWVKDARDVGYAEQILNGSGLHVDIVDKFREGGSRLLMGDWFRQGDHFAHDPIVLEKLARKILELNEIELDKVVLTRHKHAPLSDLNIKEKLNWRIGRSAVNHKIWNGYEPKNETEWYIYNRANEERLEWTVELGTTKKLDETTTERKAIVKFKKDRFGKGVIDYILPQQPDWQFFALSTPLYKDRQGVRFFPIFTVRFAVPKSIRTVCHTALEQLDNNYRKISSYELLRDSWWVRLRDYKIEDTLVVEGWPPERVDMVADEVKVILKGRVVDCKDDGSDQSPAKLLYGCGLSFVNNMQRQNMADIVLSVDRLNEKIYIWGDNTKCCAVSKVLSMYPKSLREYRINTEILISEPRFLPIFRDVLEFNGEKAVSEAVGGAVVKFWNPDRLQFIGSVDQYEKLQEMLDKEHTKMIELTKEHISFRDLDPPLDDASLIPKECPVCLQPARGAFTLEYCGHSYCLVCLTQMIRLAIKEKHVPVKCCVGDCEKIVALKDILALLFDEPSRQTPTAFKDRLESLWNSTHEIAVMQSEELTFCTKADCRAVINMAEEQKNGGNTYNCTGCGGEFCAGCFNPPHPEWSCREETEFRGNVDLSLQGYMASGGRRHDVKKCPNTRCKAVIEKEYGCNHMHCRVCNVHFCWRCMFMADTPAGIYKHMTEVHGGTGGEWAFLDEPEAVNMHHIQLGAPPGLEHRAHEMVRDIDRRGQVVMIEGHQVFVD